MRQLFSRLSCILFIIINIVAPTINRIHAQPCGPLTPSYTVNLTGNPSGTWISPSAVRNDFCCSANGSDRCIEFWVTLDPNAMGIRFDIASGAIPPGALFYQIACSAPTAVGDTICLIGTGPHRITFCKPGNNQNKYSISSIGAPKAGPPTVVSNGCSGIIYAYGYDESSLTWTSVPFNATYNSYMSCTSGCDTVVITAQPGYPPSVLYQVCGKPNGGCDSIPICDTVRVFFVSDKSATIMPQNPVICFGGPPDTLTAIGAGGALPYSYLWNTGATTSSIAAGVGTYWVEISDTTDCPPVYDTVTVIANASNISANAGANDSACTYNTVYNLNGSVAVASGGVWTGGNGIFSPNDSTLNATYTPTPAEIAAGIVALYLITTGNGPCPADTDTVVIYIMQKPIVAFTSTGQCYKDSVYFMDASTISSGSITGWSWNFGDATTSTLQNPAHSYTAAGTYTVTLIVASALGCSDTIAQTVTVQPSPLANFSFNNVCFGNAITFTDSSTIPFGSIILWNWNFGDANTSTQQNPVHTYTASGNYTVTLIVTSAIGCPDTISQLVTVYPLPIAVFTSTAQCFKDSVYFTNTSTITSGSITGWQWNFGDATTSTLQNPAHAYTAPGTYTVTLIVASNFGCMDTITQVITVQPSPLANFGFNNVCLGNAINFTDLSTIPFGNIISWNWNFGDANTSTQQNPVHTYTASGTYTVTLIVTSAIGCPDTISLPVTVYPNPAAAFTNNTGVCQGLTTIFTNQSTGNLVSWNWNFGDTTSSTLQNPSHTYSSAGTFTVTLIVTTVNGCKDTVAQTVTVNPLPVANFNSTALCFVDSVYFTNTSTIPVGSITGWQWNFGDTTASILQNPVHAYTTPGTYTVTLIVTSSFGCSDTIAQAITVQPSPLANFGFNSVCLGNPTIFTDSSTILFGTITSWNWNFGDAVTSPLQNPTHTYTAAGTYSVTLIVTSATGCKDTLVIPVTVNPLPIAAFSSLGACLSDGVVFTNLSAAPPDSVTAWQWYFGDATSSTQQHPSHTYSTSGTYGVTLIVTTNNGCKDTITQPVTVNPSPAAGFTAFPNPAFLGQNINFTNQSSGAVSWYWTFGDSATSTQQDPVHSYTLGGTYSVMQVVTNSFGCMDTAWHTIVVTAPPTIPTGFSPNGDGKNDVLFMLGGPFIKLDFNIYNNWGELIFHSENQSAGWDGTRNGVKQPLGVYVYTAYGVTEDNKEHRFKGDVMLLR